MRLCVVACASALVAGSASARPVYNDAVGDLDPFFSSQGFTHLDLVSVNITNDLTNLYVDITLNGDVNATNWGKYCMLIDSKPGGVSTPSNPWGRAINTTQLNDYWVGSWVDGGGGAQVWKNDGVAWEGVEFAATYIAGSGVSQSLAGAASGTVSYTFALSTLGLSIGQSFFFDVIATAGGTTDPGVDHLSLPTPSTPNWGTASNSGPYLQYTVIPGPGAAGLLALAGLMTVRRRR